MSQKGKDQSPAGQPLEDRALKSAAALFGEELLPLIGVKGRVLRIAPTEQVKLPQMDYMEDFNYEMEDGSFLHLEFESDNILIKDLRRYRSYESLMGQQFGVRAATYVICSSNVQELQSELDELLYTYRVKVIRLKDQNGDQVIRELEKRQQEGPLARKDLLKLLLTPLMSGKISQQERISRGMKLLRQEQVNQDPEDLARMESVLYTLAMKFLTTEELRNIREMMNMTILGEMILNDGIEKGIEKGTHTERANSVLDFLEDTGRIPRELIDAVHKEQDMERLRRWRKLAARVKSIEEFQQKYMDL